MKKYAFILMAFAIALLSSCAKEDPNKVDNAPGNYAITACIDNTVTKTYYTESGAVAELNWNALDAFKLMVYSKSTEAAAYYSFHADEDAKGSEATFTINSGSMNLESYGMAGIAVYPNTLTTGGTKDAYTVTLSGEYAIASGTDLSKVNVPMIGVPTDAADANTYIFTPAVGVLKVQLSHVPAAARKLVLKAVETDNVSGTFPLNAEKGFRMEDATSAGHTVSVSFPSQTEGSSISVYMPVPAGIISAGAVLEVQNADGIAIFTTPATTQAITVTKGHLTPLATLNAGSEWELLGVGQFQDNYSFALEGKNGCMVDVNILKSVSTENLYAIENPYGTAWNSLGVSYNSVPSILMYLAVKKAGEEIATTSKSTLLTNDNLVFFYGDGNIDNAVYTGIINEGHPYRIYHAIWATTNESSMTTTKVVSYQADGKTPAMISINPALQKYNTVYWLDQAKCSINIIFPGCNPALAIVGTYNINADNDSYQITLSESDDLSKGNVMISAYPKWELTGKIYGTYDYTSGTITFAGNQYLDLYNEKQYYYFWTEASTYPAPELTFEFSDAFLSDDPSNTVKYYTGRLLKTQGDNFGVNYLDISSNTYNATSHKWTGGTSITFYKVVN